MLSHIIPLRDAGNRARYDSDDLYRWALHRLWITAGEEAKNYVDAVSSPRRWAQPWRRLYDQRNMLAHLSLPDVDEDQVWRSTVLRAEQQYRPAVRSQLLRP